MKLKKFIVKVLGSSRLVVSHPHLHGHFNFTEYIAETVGQSLLYSSTSQIK